MSFHLCVPPIVQQLSRFIFGLTYQRSGVKTLQVLFEEAVWPRAGAPLTSLAGCAVLAVLSPVAFDHLPLAVVFLDGEADGQDVVTRLDDSQDPADPLLLLLQALPGLQALHQLVLNDSGSPVEEAFHHSEEVRVVVPVHGLAVAAIAQQGGARREKRVCTRGSDAACPPGKQLSEVSVHVEC